MDNQSTNQLFNYTLLHADNVLILAQQNSAWCGHGPVLEQDIALTNISLDLIGQARNLYQFAATLVGNGATEDSLAYLRTEREFRNWLLAEQPNGDWAQTVLRQFLFSAGQYEHFLAMQQGSSSELAAIAEKSLKEVTYHLRWSSEWVIRLGDGTEESHQRMEAAIDALWMYTGEQFDPAPFESAFLEGTPDTSCSLMKQNWEQRVHDVFEEATLPVPEKVFMQTGGKEGLHTERMGYILAEMQYLQRTYPGAEW